MQEKSAKIFKNGRNQAIRLPKDFEFEGVDEVIIRREGKSLILTPVRPSWLSFAELPVADADYMVDRPDVFDGKRIKF